MEEGAVVRMMRACACTKYEIGLLFEKQRL